jgi:hypothetical protein
MTDYELPQVPKLRSVKPWDLLDKNMPRAPERVQKERMEMCRSCPFFIKITGQCRMCGCFMEAKTRLADAACPENKWFEHKA